MRRIVTFNLVDSQPPPKGTLADRGIPPDDFVMDLSISMPCLGIVDGERGEYLSLTIRIHACVRYCQSTGQTGAGGVDGDKKLFCGNNL